jgi:hypothetical protein
LTEQTREKAEDARARKTTLIVGSVLLVIAAWNLYRWRLTVVSVAGGLGLGLWITGLLLPRAARAFHDLWSRVAAVLGYLNSRILLSLIFYGVLTPYALVSRLVGRNPLRRRGGSRESYWVSRPTTRQTKEQFERLF